MCEGESPSLDGLLSSLEDRDIDWALTKAVPRRGAAERVRHPARRGVGRPLPARGPLPRPERNDVNVPAAWDLLLQARNRIRLAMTASADYWELAQAV